MPREVQNVVASLVTKWPFFLAQTGGGVAKRAQAMVFQARVGISALLLFH